MRTFIVNPTWLMSSVWLEVPTAHTGDVMHFEAQAYIHVHVCSMPRFCVDVCGLFLWTEQLVAIQAPPLLRTPALEPMQSAVRKAGVQALKVVFTASKRSSLDDALRSSGCLDVILMVLRTGVTFVQPGAQHTGTGNRPVATPRTTGMQPGVVGSTSGEAVPVFRLSDCPCGIDELVYACGTLKNASSSSENAKWLVSQGAVWVLTAVMFAASKTLRQPSGTSRWEGADVGADVAVTTDPSPRQLGQLLV